MDISVILCTYNRCESLAKALASVAKLEFPRHVEWDVLVVDNNSRDNTPGVVNEFVREYPGRFRYLFEPRSGKSFALNTGIHEAKGAVLVFTDDDVVVEPTWADNLTNSIRNGDWIGSGGRVLPEQAFTPPRWLSVEGKWALGPLAMFDLGLEAIPLDSPPFGNNMAYRREVFEKYGEFRTDLGPRPGNEIRNEDTEFGARLLKAGQRLRYEPSAVVYHAVPRNRVQKEYFLKWWFDKARTEIRVEECPQNALNCKGVPLVMFRRLAMWAFRWMTSIDPATRFECKLKVWQVSGYIVEYFRRSSRRGESEKAYNAQS
jgi:glycosyltransferase involved in cell wall biosynthesis